MCGLRGVEPTLPTSRSIQSNQACGAKDERDPGDDRRRAQRDPQLAPLTTHGEPEQTDPGAGLGQQHEGPGPRVAEAQHDGDGQEDVDVAVVQLQGHERDGEGDRHPGGAAGDPDDRPDEQHGPEVDEDPPVDAAEPVGHLGEGGTVVEGAQGTDGDGVRIGHGDVPVGIGVEPEGSGLWRHDQEQVGQEQQPGHDQAGRDRPTEAGARRRAGGGHVADSVGTAPHRTTVRKSGHRAGPPVRACRHTPRIEVVRGPRTSRTRPTAARPAGRRRPPEERRARLASGDCRGPSRKATRRPGTWYSTAAAAEEDRRERETRDDPVGRTNAVVTEEDEQEEVEEQDRQKADDEGVGHPFRDGPTGAMEWTVPIGLAAT